MNQLRTQEFRLSEAIDDAELALSDLRSEKRTLLEQAASLKKSVSELAKDFQECSLKADAELKELRLEIQQARKVSGHMEAHVKWKEAVRLCFGQDGLDKCIQHMQDAP